MTVIPLVAHAVPPDPALAIFWDNRHEGWVLSLQHQDRLWAYIQPLPTATTLLAQRRSVGPPASLVPSSSGALPEG